MPAGPDTTRADLDATRLEHAFELVAQQVRSGRAGYAALTVARGDGVVRSGAWAHEESLDGPRRTSIASITKPITAAAVMQQVEAGRLVLTEPVRTYLPEFAPVPPGQAGDGTQAEPITLWHVLTHTAGLTDAPDKLFGEGPASREELLDWLCRAPLRFQPGTAYAYASDSYFVLSAVVERVTGDRFADVLRAGIFEPLGMTATTFDPSDAGPPPLPLAGRIGPPDVPHEDVARSFFALESPGGGLWSVPDDMARFGRAMLRGGTLDGTRILGRPFVRLMTRLHTGDVRDVVEQRQPNYGLGCGLPGLGRGSPASPSAFGHSGATGSALLVDPASDLVVAYLRNEWGASMTATDEAIQAVYGALEDQ